MGRATSWKPTNKPNLGGRSTVSSLIVLVIDTETTVRIGQTLLELLVGLEVITLKIDYRYIKNLKYLFAATNNIDYEHEEGKEGILK